VVRCKTRPCSRRPAKKSALFLACLRLSRLPAGGLGFDESDDPVVHFVDAVEAAVAAGDDDDLRVRHKASAGAGLFRVSSALRAPVIRRAGTVTSRSWLSVRMAGFFGSMLCPGHTRLLSSVTVSERPPSFYDTIVSLTNRKVKDEQR
jgi:hypothetical protein